MNNDGAEIDTGKSRKREEKTAKKIAEFLAVQIDPITRELIMAMVSNPRMYVGMADDDDVIVRTAIRLRRRLTDEGLAGPVIPVSKS
jgi:hypothetical protein